MVTLIAFCVGVAVGYVMLRLVSDVLSDEAKDAAWAQGHRDALLEVRSGVIDVYGELLTPSRFEFEVRG